MEPDALKKTIDSDREMLTLKSSLSLKVEISDVTSYAKYLTNALYSDRKIVE